MKNQPFFLTISIDSLIIRLRLARMHYDGFSRRGALMVSFLWISVVHFCGIFMHDAVQVCEGGVERLSVLHCGRMSKH